MHNTLPNTSKLEVNELIHSVFKDSPTVGAIVVAGTIKDVYFNESFGVVHHSSLSPITKDTFFDIQSITKVMGTISLLEAFQRLGKISLQDSIQKHLPEFHQGQDCKITIQDLVLHQSGISDEDFAAKFNTPNDLWQSMLNAPLRSNPGSSIEYTDVGYRILGLCLEKIGNDNLDELCKKHVWQSLGMYNTTYRIQKIKKELIAGQGNTWGVLDDTQDRFLEKPLGCDGVFTTASDLALFCQHWLRKLNDEKTNQKITSIYAGNTNPNWSYYESLGLGKKLFGWEQHDVNQSYIGMRKTPSTLEKAGGAGAFICLRPEYEDFFIYLTNHGRPDPFSMEAWNSLVSSLKVKDIACKVLRI